MLQAEEYCLSEGQDGRDRKKAGDVQQGIIVQFLHLAQLDSFTSTTQFNFYYLYVWEGCPGLSEFSCWCRR